MKVMTKSLLLALTLVALGFTAFSSSAVANDEVGNGLRDQVETQVSCYDPLLNMWGRRMDCRPMAAQSCVPDWGCRLWRF